MQFRTPALILGLMTISWAMPAEAGSTIARACMGSDRPAASRELCGCIQNVADSMLSAGDQRRGAKFFADPHLSQEVRASSSREDDLFWERWTEFGKAATAYCR